MFAQAQESMSRTAQKMIADGKPFTDTVTTHTFMMTPALMSMYLAIDQSQVDDAAKVSVSVPMPDGTISTTQAFWLTYQADAPIPLTDTIDPASPNFMHFAVAAPFSCSVPVLDATGHVVVDAAGKATKVDVKYNQRKSQRHQRLPRTLWLGASANTRAIPPIRTGRHHHDSGRRPGRAKSTLSSHLRWRRPSHRPT